MLRKNISYKKNKKGTEGGNEIMNNSININRL